MSIQLAGGEARTGGPSGPQPSRRETGPDLPPRDLLLSSPQHRGSLRLPGPAFPPTMRTVTSLAPQGLIHLAEHTWPWRRTLGRPGEVWFTGMQTFCVLRGGWGWTLTTGTQGQTSSRAPGGWAFHWECQPGWVHQRVGGAQEGWLLGET